MSDKGRPLSIDASHPVSLASAGGVAPACACPTQSEWRCGQAMPLDLEVKFCTDDFPMCKVVHQMCAELTTRGMGHFHVGVGDQG